MMTNTTISIGDLPPTTASWHSLLNSPAISYIPPSRSQYSGEFYWHPALLNQWQHLLFQNKFDESIATSSKKKDDDEPLPSPSSTEAINYGSLMLLAAYIADELRRRLRLQPATTAAAGPGMKCNSPSPPCSQNIPRYTTSNNTLRIGMAIPEGPFLPLFVLVVHSLNIAFAQRWLLLAATAYDYATGVAVSAEADANSSRDVEWCCDGGVVLIPMETDEAPERLKHILSDSCPNLILVASGDDWRRMENALRLQAVGEEDKSAASTATSAATQLVDFVEVVEAALTSISTQMMMQQPQQQQHDICNSVLVMEHLWPLDIRETAIIFDSSSSSSWDVARLVAIGCTRLATTSSFIESATKSSSLLSHYITSSLSTIALSSSSSSSSNNRTIMSHIVYTSGTTGVPKGCISSLSSLQHYIRAKNVSHGITSLSHVMLSSAVTFDPCFSDVLATFLANGTLCLVSRGMLYGHHGEDDYGDGGGGEFDNDDSDNRGLTTLLRQLEVTHVLCTPTLWAMVEGDPTRNGIYMPSLKVVALGGEPIPMAIRRKWARKKRMVASAAAATDGDWRSERAMDRDYPRLFATYGVTEACVYQTCGEVIEEMYHSNDNKSNSNGAIKTGHSVGFPMLGTHVSICRPHLSEDNNDEEMNDLDFIKLEKLEQGDESNPVIGEVVLSGEQVDGMSSYLNLPELTRRVFLRSFEQEADSSIRCSFFYRTGDLGYIDKRTGELYIAGRIKGDGMVKINGIRIELSEIETSVIDDIVNDIVDDDSALVIDCMAAVKLTKLSSLESGNEENERKQLIAYCILSASSILQLGINAEHLKTGVIVPRSPLLSLLRARCDRRVRKGCMPSFFVIIDKLPLSPTGKRNRSALPGIEKCSIGMSLSAGEDSSISLWECGVSGPIVAEKVCECLNLQPCQKSLVTASSSFFILGGDSLAATRVTRGLYALHHKIGDSRHLGGSSGTIQGPFAAKFLLQANTLGEYCGFLDSHSAFCNEEQKDGSVIKTGINHPGGTGNPKHPETLYESLIESITLGHSNVCIALLDFVDCNVKLTNARLGKVTDRKQQRSLFKSNPLHLACIRGDPKLVRILLAKGCKANSPDASGAFPIHLACSHLETAAYSDKEDLSRRECVRVLLEAGTPIAIKDGNKQTILHCAARSGHVELLKFIMIEWKKASNAPNGIKFKSYGNLGSIYDWTDRWYRTPVHWAILNKRIESLRALLDGGCSASPPKPKLGVSKRATSVFIETPMEMSERLYGDAGGVGQEISTLLANASVR